MAEPVQADNPPRGEEYTCRVFQWMITEAEERGVTREQMLDGVPYSIEHLYDKNARLDWESACRFFSNLGQYLTDDELVTLGRSGADSPIYRYILVIARLLFTTREFYHWSILESSPEYIRCMRFACRDLGPGRMRAEYSMDEGYLVSREFFLVLKGLLESCPFALGLPYATVDAEIGERRAVYEISFVEAGGALSWLRRAWRWLWSARAGAQELRDAHDQLQARFHRLEEERVGRKAAEEALLTIREQERDRIRRDLHDGVGQKLTGLGLIAKSLTTKLERRGSYASRGADALKRNCERLLDELRAAVLALEPRKVPRDALRKALHRLSHQCREDWGVLCEIQIPENLAAPNDDWATAVCLIAEEALRFTVEQGASGEILLQMEQISGDLRFRISVHRSADDAADRSANDLGFRILQRRFEALGGTLIPGKKSQNGVFVGGTVPIPD